MVDDHDMDKSFWTPDYQHQCVKSGWLHKASQHLTLVGFPQTVTNEKRMCCPSLQLRSLNLYMHDTAAMQKAWSIKTVCHDCHWRILVACTESWPQSHRTLGMNWNADYALDLLAQHHCLTSLMLLLLNGQNLPTTMLQIVVESLLRRVDSVISASTNYGLYSVHFSHRITPHCSFSCSLFGSPATKAGPRHRESTGSCFWTRGHKV